MCRNLGNHAQVWPNLEGIRMSRTPRNSRTDRLRITWIPILSFQNATRRYEKGQIGMTLCPGKYQPQSMSGGWDRDLDLDIKELKKSNVGHVISLITIEEIQELKVNSLGHKLQINEITWHHLPTPDTEVPSEEWMMESLRIIVKLMPNFYSGERVVVHCKGGISRAGIFTCLVLWMMGHDEMDDNIDLVRRLRDYRGINQKQEQHLLDFAENYQTWIQGMCQLDQWQEGLI